MSIDKPVERIPLFKYKTRDSLGDWAPKQRAFIASKLSNYSEGWLQGDFTELSKDVLVQTDWLSMLMVNFEDAWHHFDDCVDPTPNRWLRFPSEYMASLRKSNTLFFSNQWLYEFEESLGVRGGIRMYQNELYKKIRGVKEISWREKGSKNPYGQLMSDLGSLFVDEIHELYQEMMASLPYWSRYVLSSTLSLISKCDILDIQHPMLETMRHAILAGAIPCDVQKRNGEEKLVVFWIHPFPPRGWEEICGVQ